VPVVAVSAVGVAEAGVFSPPVFVVGAGVGAPVVTAAGGGADVGA